MKPKDGNAPVHQPTHIRIAAALRTALMCGQYPPGAVLTLRPLASRFRVSPMPVREALRQLVAERALVVEANGSVSVPTLDITHFSDLRRIRLMLEGVAAELAASRITDEQLDELQVLIEASEETVDTTPRPNLERNRRFHFGVYAASGSTVLVPLIESLWLQFGPYLQVVIEHIGGDLGTGDDYHRRVLDALDRRDPKAAREALERDIARAMDIMLEIYAGEGADPGAPGGDPPATLGDEEPCQHT